MPTGPWKKTSSGTLVPLSVKKKKGNQLVDVVSNTSTGGGGGPVTPEPPVYDTSKIFPKAGWLYTKIPPNPVLDVNSANLASRLNSGNRVALTEDYATPIYFATESDPLYSVARGNLQVNNPWGVSTDIQTVEFRIPLHALPSPGTDGWIVVFDRTPSSGYPMGRAVMLWRFEHNGGSNRKCQSGGIIGLNTFASTHKVAHAALTDQWLVNMINAGGVYSDEAVEWHWPQPLTQGTASGVSIGAGMVTVEDVKSGVIAHTLAAAVNKDLVSGPSRQGAYRFPAFSTDARATPYNASAQFVMGSRIQFPPDHNMNQYSGLTKMIGIAGQQYGIVITDTTDGGTAICVGCELATTPEKRAVYTPLGMGIGAGYFDLSALPWTSARVLRRWDGTANGTTARLLS